MKLHLYLNISVYTNIYTLCILLYRPRDKERYRLRKQQRKNDVEAYRKMQQLRREFGRARELLQLVHERETLRETEITFQREIFELEVSELDENDDFKLKSKIDAYLPLQPPKLMFPHFFDTVFMLCSIHKDTRYIIVILFANICLYIIYFSY